MKNFIFFSLITILFSSCKGDDSNCCTPPMETNCNKFVNINEVHFNEVSTTNYTIRDVVLIDNCLSILISSSGCNAQNWDMNFIVSPNVVETLPLQYQGKVELINDEACLAVLEKVMTFDLMPLQVAGQNQIQINIEGWNSNTIYNY